MIPLDEKTLAILPLSLMKLDRSEQKMVVTFLKERANTPNENLVFEPDFWFGRKVNDEDAGKTVRF